MKQIFTILVAVLVTATLWAQSPEKMSYQAVVRDASDNLITNTYVGMQISILQGSADGTAVYVETQTPTTNANGLITIEIGEGTTTDDFSVINWANGPYFIKTETDPAVGINYTITGTSQLLSVPYALHAKTAENVTGTIIETDPVYTEWDKSSGISITESQISDLDHFTNTDETDPVFGASVASGITATDTTTWNTESDFSGDYNDLTNTPTIPTNVSDLANDSGYITSPDDADADATNEIQDLLLTGNILTITSNGTATEIDLSAYLDNTDTQLTETEVDSYVSNNGYLTTEVDGSVTNEIQDLQLTGNIL
ncbi:MAG: hypothetical protein KAT68_10670, partial [Bacteroidales bacterium]|nr:hypothetical protein [Bacteroidales bacterium]